MRKEHCAAPRHRVHALQNMLEECIVGPPLWRRAQKVAVPHIALPCRAVPLFDRVGGISQHHVESAQSVALDERWRRERVAVGDVKIRDAVEHEVHPGDGGCDVDKLLSVKARAACIAATTFYLGYAGYEHAARAAGGIVDLLAGLRLEHLRHEVHERAVGI